jgi:hypothetical protein
MTKFDRAELESRIRANYQRLDQAGNLQYSGPGGTKELGEAAATKRAEVDGFKQGRARTESIAAQFEGEDALGAHREALARQIREALAENEPRLAGLEAEQAAREDAHRLSEAVGKEIYEARVGILNVARADAGPFHIDAQLRNDLNSWRCIAKVLDWVDSKPGREDLIDVEALREYRTLIHGPVSDFAAKIEGLLDGARTIGEVIPSPVFAHPENAHLARLELSEFFEAIPALFDTASEKNPITQHLSARDKEEARKLFVDLAALSRAGEPQRTAMLELLERTARTVEFGWGPDLDFSRILSFIFVTHREIRPSALAFAAADAPAPA